MLNTEATLLKILAEMKVHAPDYWEDFNGDYKEAAVIEEELFLDVCNHLEIPAESEVDAASCPRSWRVRFTAEDGSIGYYPVR